MSKIFTGKSNRRGARCWLVGLLGLAVMSGVLATAGAAPASASETGLLGSTDGTRYEVSCPQGEYAVGLYILAGANEFTPPAQVKLICSGGSRTDAVGFAPLNQGGPEGDSACSPNDRVMGLGTIRGEILDSLYARCGVAPDFDTDYSASPVGGPGGETLEITGCEQGAFLTGVTVWSTYYGGEAAVKGIQGSCAMALDIELSAPNAVYLGQPVPVTATAVPWMESVWVRGTMRFLVDGAPEEVPFEFDDAVLDVIAGMEPKAVSAEFLGSPDFLAGDSGPDDLTVQAEGLSYVGAAGPGDSTEYTACPSGESVTALRVSVRDELFVAGLRLVCEGGSVSPQTGEGPGEAVSTVDVDCGTDSLVGLYSRYGAIADTFAARCRDQAGEIYTTDLAGGPGGVPSNQADCPGTSFLVGLAVEIEDFGGPTVDNAVGYCGDLLPPKVTVNELPVAAWVSSVEMALSAVDDSEVVSYDVRTRSAGYRQPFGDWRLPDIMQGTDFTSFAFNVPDSGSHDCYAVRATDLLGNISDWSPTQCVAGPLDDKGLKRSKGWKSKKKDFWFEGTSSTSTRKGASLSSGRATQVRRVGVIADTCPTCGKVAMFVGKKKIGTLSLKSASLEHQQVLVLPRFGKRGGVVKVAVVSKKKRVVIDGLIIGR